MSSINFDNVYLLFIIIPLLALITVPFFLAIKKENANGHNIASMALHVLMAVIIAFAAAGTQVVTVITETNVYVLADVSYSANKNLDTVDNYIRDLSRNLPRNSKMGVLCFGKDCVQLTSLGGSLKSVKTAQVDDSETNIAEAMEYAGTLFKDGVIKRLVVITDGKQTYSGDESELRRTVTNLQGQNIHVDAIFLDDTLSPNAKEVQISGADYTRKTYLGHKEEVSVTVDSSFATSNTTVEIYKNGEILEDKTKKNRSFPMGTSTVSFELDTAEMGVFNYEVKIIDESDESSLNNNYSFTQTVSGEVKVLFVGSKNEDAEYVEKIYGESAEIDSYINDADTPYTLEELCGYDEIVLSDIDLTEVMPYRYESFMQNINTAVSAFGKSVVTFGNMFIQDKTDGTLKQLDDMLPVRFGDAVDNPKLFTIVIDVSYSMNMWSRMRLAKQAAKGLLKTLSDDDYVSVVAFSGSTEQVLPPTSLRNREDVLNYIDGLKFEQGTLISAGLNRAFNMIKSLNYSEKQVMLISDGISYDSYTGEDSEDNNECVSLVQTMRGYRIYTSVICVSGGNDDYRDSMRNLAKQGGGTYYWAQNDDALAGIIFGEILEENDDAEVTEDTWVTLSKPRDEIVAGNEDKNLADVGFSTNSDFVNYYVLSRAKSSATTVLSVNYEYVIDESRVNLDLPLFAYWNYGNGRVASFTGRVSELRKYGGDKSERNDAFFRNVLTYAVPEEKIDAPFTVNTELAGKSAIIQLTPGEVRSRATARMEVTSPSGVKETHTLTFDSMSYYQQFKANEIGRYGIKLIYSYGGADYTTDVFLDVPYEPEYNSFEVYDAAVLYKMLGGDGTVSLDGKLTIENDENEQETYVLRLGMPLMATAVILFVVDIIIRKLKWKDIVSLFGFGRGTKKDKGKK